MSSLLRCRGRHAFQWDELLITILRPDVTLEFHHVARRIGDHEALMLVRRFAKAHHGTHHKLDPEALDVVAHSREVVVLQKCEPEMPRIRPWIDFDRAPFEMTDQLQNPAEAECDAVFQHPYRLCTKHFGVPAGSLLERAARHRDVRDVASRNDLGVVQQAVGELEFGHVAIKRMPPGKAYQQRRARSAVLVIRMTNVDTRSRGASQPAP